MALCALRNSFAAALAGTGSALESLPREDPESDMRLDIETMKETPDLVYSGNTGQKLHKLNNAIKTCI